MPLFGPFDDIVDVVDDIIDGVIDTADLVRDTAESLANEVDQTVAGNITSRCSQVKVESAQGDVATTVVVDDCGQSIVALKDVFADAGGEVARQAEAVANEMGEIPEQEWDDISADAANAPKAVLDAIAEQAVVSLEDNATLLFEKVSDPEELFSLVGFEVSDLLQVSSVELAYDVSLGPVDIGVSIAGVVLNEISETGLEFSQFLGVVKIKVATALAEVGYTPATEVSLEYVNPIFRVEDGRLTGIAIGEPNGAIFLVGTISPLRVTASLAEIRKIPGLRNLDSLASFDDRIAFNADIASATFRFPISDEGVDRFSFVVIISGGVDMAVKLVGGLSIAFAERIAYPRTITLDIPPLNWISGPPGLLGPTEPPEEPANRVVSYTFEDGNGTAVQDMSNQNNDGEVKGGVEIANGVARLDGQGGHIQLPNNIVKDLDEVTIYAEILIDPAQQAPYFIYGIGNTKDGLGDGYIFTTGDDYRSSISLCHWICEQTTTTDDGINLPRGTWLELVYTIDGDVASIYLNGSLVGEEVNITNKPSDIGNGATTANYIGRSLYASDNYFQGSIRNFEIWDRALTHTEIIDEYATT